MVPLKNFLQEKLEKLHNIFIKSNSELIRQDIDMVEIELKILREEKGPSQNGK